MMTPHYFIVILALFILFIVFIRGQMVGWAVVVVGLVRRQKRQRLGLKHYV